MYVADIYETLTTTPRAELKLLAEELKQEVPEPLHSMLVNKESREDAITKYRKRQEMETVICPPTCTGINGRQFLCVCPIIHHFINLFVFLTAASHGFTATLTMLCCNP